jgi:hypothetical protein
MDKEIIELIGRYGISGIVVYKIMDFLEFVAVFALLAWPARAVWTWFKGKDIL